MTCPACGKHHAGTELSPGMKSTVCARCVWNQKNQGVLPLQPAALHPGQRSRKKAPNKT